jgi:tRNA 2-thiouridine synthesizing protein B
MYTGEFILKVGAEDRLHSVYVLKEDAEARGVLIESDKIQLITYAEFVELCIKYDKIVSW